MSTKFHRYFDRVPKIDVHIEIKIHSLVSKESKTKGTKIVVHVRREERRWQRTSLIEKKSRRESTRNMEQKRFVSSAAAFRADANTNTKGLLRAWRTRRFPACGCSCLFNHVLQSILCESRCKKEAEHRVDCCIDFSSWTSPWAFDFIRQDNYRNFHPPVAFVAYNFSKHLYYSHFTTLCQGNEAIQTNERNIIVVAYEEYLLVRFILYKWGV